MKISIDWDLVFESMKFYLIEELQRRAPTHDGDLKRSITAAIQDDRLVISALHYAIYVDEGCLFGNSHRYKVLTKRGYKSLKDVKIGDLVLTHTGNWRKVIAKPVKPIIKKIPRYTIKTNNNSVTVTDNHLIYCKRNNKWIWIKAMDLKVGDIVREVI